MVNGADGSIVGCHDYLPFGEEIPNTVGTRSGNCWNAVDTSLKFTGKERDAETGLDYFGARYMSSAQGRFTSPDEALADRHPEDPQSWNIYAYVRNNPLAHVDPDGHDCVVQTRTSDTSQTVAVTAGDCKKISVGDGQTKTYIAGMVDTGSIQSNGAGGITFGFSPYSGGGGVADLKAAPVPDYPGIAPGWGNNAQGYQQIAAAGRFINNTAAVYAGVYGSIFAAAAGAEIATATAASRSGIIFRLAHGLRFASVHSPVIGSEAAIKNAIAAAISSGAIQKLGGSAFEGVVNVGGACIRFTGAFTPSGVVVSNVMGNALKR